jgi:hypothetical protein
MVPLPEAVPIPMVPQQLVEGQFKPSETNERAITTMLNELLRWIDALRPLRASSPKGP